jgi:hypothetical protein
VVRRVDVVGNECRRGLKMLLKLFVHICWDVVNPRTYCVGLLDFSGPAEQHLRILRPTVWVSWISPVLFHSICVCGCVGLLDFSGPVAQHFCGILYVGDIAKFPCFCLWNPFGLWLKFREVYLGCDVYIHYLSKRMFTPGVGLLDVPLGA